MEKNVNTKFVCSQNNCDECLKISFVVLGFKTYKKSFLKQHLKTSCLCTTPRINRFDFQSHFFPILAKNAMSWKRMPFSKTITHNFVATLLKIITQGLSLNISAAFELPSTTRTTTIQVSSTVTLWKEHQQQQQHYESNIINNSINKNSTNSIIINIALTCTCRVLDVKPPAEDGQDKDHPEWQPVCDEVNEKARDENDISPTSFLYSI